MNKYQNINQDLKNWFIIMQSRFKDFHCAEAGRGHIDQEAMFSKGASKAHWGQSSHNYNCALDCFFLVDNKYSLDEEKFKEIFPEIPEYISWYGAFGAKFYERPHYEIKAWRLLLAQGKLSLVQ